ncbi:MAG: hypothetical protein KF773_41820 [Deltaproteobacteria bacterium]|nr:hypothetical protein [Deltaproteobacteria bacterium]MCW5807064.1 hypothetical protein [Deltaproteobacteria bacterium]
MRRGAAVVLAIALVGCAGEDDKFDPNAPMTLPFGPYELAAGEEHINDCVQITLNNDEAMYINAVELTTGAGFHHSNWFFVPETIFAGEDGTYRCNERNFNEPAAAIFGGVIFAQSTQAPHEVQQFPEGVVVKLPPRQKLVANIHLLNATDGTLKLSPKIELRPIPEAKVTTRLAGISFTNEALGLPPNKVSKFSIECDVATQHQAAFGKAPDFNIYYALAHYHELATRLDVEAVRADGSTTTVFTTSVLPGDVMGGMLTPTFGMTGFEKLRLSCTYFNPRAEVVRWGFGDQEMCVFLAFSDSPYNWGGGMLEQDPPANETQVGNEMHYSNGCQVFANDASR